MSRLSDKDKEIYFLWWEYLRRSEDYKELCSWGNKRRKGLQIPPSLKFRFRRGKDGNGPDLVVTYLLCGNVHAYTFDEWWEWIQYKFMYAEKHGSRSPKRVEEFSGELAGFHIQQSIRDFKQENQREPSLTELVEYFPSWLQNKNLYRGTLYLMIEVAGTQTQELVLKIKKEIAKKRKNDPYINAYEKKSRRDLIPTANKRLDELRRYLVIYDDNKKGLTIPEIIKKRYSNQSTQSNAESVRRACLADIEKAKRIIKNVEHAIFPGYYEKAPQLPGKNK